VRPAIFAVAGSAAAIAVAILAANVDLANHVAPVSTAMDVVAGLAFVGGAAVAPGPARARALFCAVGVAWLLGSLVPQTLLAYSEILAIALLTFPNGRPTGVWRWLLIAILLFAIAAEPGDAVLAGLFAIVAVTTAGSLRHEPAAAVFPAVAAGALSVVLGAYALAQQTSAQLDQDQWLLAYESILVVIGLAFPIAARAVVRGRAALADRLLAGDQPAGLEGLAQLLASMLGDPGLRILRWDGSGGAPLGAGRALLMVDDGPDPLAVVVHDDVAAIRDPATARAVTDAVRLTALNERWQAALALQLSELEAARSRLVAATDRQRVAIAARLRDDVVRPIEAAIVALQGVAAADGGHEARHAVSVAVDELTASVGQVDALTSGVPPVALGDGGLIEAITRLADRSPVPVLLSLAADAKGDREPETALFYVCSEALANTIKHAQASGVRIGLRPDRGLLVLVVADDGVGGATMGGFGLHGLADRLAAAGGRLRVDSPAGAGTTITASISARTIS
jgi:signal transduction histidine kinase